MRKIKEILRLHLLGGVARTRRIGQAVGCGKSAVAECLRRAIGAGLTDWAAVEALDETALERRLYPAVGADRSAALRAIRDALRRNLHRSPVEVGRWLQRVVQGYFNYHAIRGNSHRLDVFRSQVVRLWLQALRRRSQRHRMPWRRFARCVNRWIPYPRVLHPSLLERFAARHPR